MVSQSTHLFLDGNDLLTLFFRLTLINGFAGSSKHPSMTFAPNLNHLLVLDFSLDLAISSVLNEDNPVELMECFPSIFNDSYILSDVMTSLKTTQGPMLMPMLTKLTLGTETCTFHLTGIPHLPVVTWNYI